MPFPSWLRTTQVTARAVWDARGEEPEALAERIAVQLAAYDELLGAGARWALVEEDDRVVSTDPSSLTPIVSAHVFRDAEGIEFSPRGYVLGLAREGSAGFVSIRFRVGAAKIVRRMPANGVQVTIAGPLREANRLSIDADLAEGVLRGLVRAWNPDAAAVYDDAGAIASEGRGKFAPVIGQRTWVSDRVGAVETSTSGVQVERADGGSYLTADDALDSESAVREVWATLQANEVTEIVRAA